MIVIPKSNTQTRRNGNGNAKPDYDEQPGWGSAFHRPENQAPQPSYTGSGMLDPETLRAIFDAGGEFQISVWPRRARTGTKYLRFHIEPPYQGGSESDELDDDEFAGNDAEPEAEAEAPDDDMPF